MSENRRKQKNDDLDDRMLLACDLLMEGKLSRTEIAERVGIHRNTLTQWLKDERMEAELQRRAEKISRQTAKLIKARSKEAMEVMNELLHCGDKRVQMQAAQYILDQGLGKAWRKVEVATTEKKSDFDIDEALNEVDEDTEQTPITLVS